MLDSLAPPVHTPLPPFAGWAGPRNPKMLIVAEAWGENEAQVRQPLVGASGLELWRMLGEALPDLEPQLHAQAIREYYRFGNAWIRMSRQRWLTAAGIAYTNVLNFRPPNNKLEPLCTSKKDLPHDYQWPAISRASYLRPEYLPEVSRLQSEIEMANPNLVVAAGNTACWALLRATNIGSIRGAIATTAAGGRKCLPTYHPAAILRQWNWRPILVADLIKAHREAQFPELVRPERAILINPSLEELLQWTSQTLANPPPLLSCDIETRWGQITCIGFARSPASALCVPFVDPARPSGCYWRTAGEEFHAWAAVRRLLASPIPKLFQNGLYDIQYIIKMGLSVANATEDTMLLHHSIFPEMRKGLGFLGSIYTNESAWKLMTRPKADTEKRDE